MLLSACLKGSLETFRFEMQQYASLKLCKFFSFNWCDAKCPIFTENTPFPFEILAATCPFLRIPPCLFQIKAETLASLLSLKE
jgi:hypothetical protein